MNSLTFVNPVLHSSGWVYPACPSLIVTRIDMQIVKSRTQINDTNPPY